MLKKELQPIHLFDIKDAEELVANVLWPGKDEPVTWLRNVSLVMGGSFSGDDISRLVGAIARLLIKERGGSVRLPSRGRRKGPETGKRSSKG